MSRVLTILALTAALGACSAPEVSSRLAFDPYTLGPVTP